MACSKPVPSTISFAEIVQGRDATVRVTPDGMIYAVDLVMVMTGKNCNDSNECLRELNSSSFNKEKFLIRSRSRLVSFEHALELVMVLPGQTAKETRVQFANIIRRYMAGDATLHAEIQANGSSSSPIAQMARESLGLQSAVDEQLVGFKRKREELELLKLEEEIRAMARTRLANLKNDLEELADPAATKLDERTRLMFKDSYMNLLMTPSSGASGQQSLIANGPSPSPNKPISIASVAAQLGFKPTSEDAKRIGMDLRKRYMKQHGKPPPKHDQLCDGRVTLVNSFTEQDRVLVEEALYAYFRPEDECEDNEHGSIAGV